ncbi:wax ester/triacylglycerol synthase domain-containing protein [Streptomyces sp. ITFR-16]|uniref:wax ester/triacylglycerol synthase domain-containing protein n=1 Tax=Streptomyces sp. ITFR-16 TaxID=3075198 RepID=UPI0028895545|nr:wax ester/triacylglycerol synthase domain-containing protein [Streptomyces sp. ITFR-16]WNI26760.1 WS/DGAT domain-containing protein [Streptomyces sp. ITFR-16]
MHDHDAATAGERWFDYAAAHPHSSMEIGGVAVIAGPAPSTTELHALIDLVRAAHPPLRDRARPRGTNAGGRAELAEHLQEVELRAHGGDVALHAAIERVCAQPLADVSWGMTLLHGHRDNEFALLLRAHHGLLDGMSLIGIMLAAVREPRLPHRRTPPAPSPSWTTGRVRALVRAVAGLALPARTISLGPPRGQAPTGPPRRLWVHTPLPRIKAIARAAGTSLNDVYLAALAGALRPGLSERATGTVRAIVPLNTRRSSTSTALGNFHRGVPVVLPCHMPTAAERLAATHLATANILTSRRDPDADVLFDVLPSRWHGRALTRILHPRRTTMVATHVPGPAHPLELEGRSIEALLPLMFLPAGHHLSVCLGEYAGTAHLAVVADPSLSGIDELPTRWLAELDALQATFTQPRRSSDANVQSAR